MLLFVEKTEPMKSYYLTNRSKYLYAGLSAIVLVAFFLVVYYFRNAVCFSLYILGFGILSGYYTIHKIRNEHITISKNGIEYHSPWIIIETGWESVEKISHYWHDGFRYECLLVDNSQTRIKKWSFPDRYPPTPLEGFPHKTIFPLSCYAYNWRNSELGQQIKLFAPQLFE